jgi:quercetin dioxygenase-like cupin family protein
MKHSLKIVMTLAFLVCLTMPVHAGSPNTDCHPEVLSTPQFDKQGIARTETVRNDFDGGRQAIQVRVDFAPDASFPKHSHPGTEIAYVLKGTIEYEIDGKTIHLKAGESLYIPAGAIHSAKNSGPDIASELATYIVDKHKPIVILSQGH